MMFLHEQYEKRHQEVAPRGRSRGTLGALLIRDDDVSYHVGDVLCTHTHIVVFHQLRWRGRSTHRNLRLCADGKWLWSFMNSNSHEGV